MSTKSASITMGEDRSGDNSLPTGHVEKFSDAAAQGHTATDEYVINPPSRARQRLPQDMERLESNGRDANSSLGMATLLWRSIRKPKLG